MLSCRFHHANVTAFSPRRRQNSACVKPLDSHAVTIRRQYLARSVICTSTQIIAHARADSDETPVSVGYDRVRFLAPVFLGDTVTVRYTIAEVDLDRRRSVSSIEVTNQDGDLVAVASHILQWVAND